MVNIEIGNYTINVSEIFDKALGHSLTGLNKKRCKDVVLNLEKAVLYMKENKVELEKLNPKNGWGNYEGALEYLEKILKKCKDYPSGKIIVCA